ncbi:hypothetical protein GCM10008949_50400 [Deinococcus humi]|nr:hypothetical protein GCM10008949_50400 [Deinococcus humi]
MELVRTEPRPSWTSGIDGWNTVQRRFQQLGIVQVGWGEHHGQRRSDAVHQKATFGTGLPSVNRIGAGVLTASDGTDTA